MAIHTEAEINIDRPRTEVFDYLASPSDDPQLDWKVRHRENADKMTGGGLFGTVEVLKGLHALSRVRPLPQKERELYDSAKHFLDFTWSPDGAILLVQVDDGDEWLYFRPDRAGPIGRVTPGGWRPEWCRCAPRT